jgi:hypothetical protein
LTSNKSAGRPLYTCRHPQGAAVLIERQLQPLNESPLGKLKANVEEAAARGKDWCATSSGG